MQGFAEVVAQAVVPKETADAMLHDVRMLGAVHVSELSADDWAGLPSWAKMRPLERRRWLAVTRGV